MCLLYASPNGQIFHLLSDSKDYSEKFPFAKGFLPHAFESLQIHSIKTTLACYLKPVEPQPQDFCCAFMQIVCTSKLLVAPFVL